MLSAFEAWPERIETVDTVELLTPAPITEGSRVRLKQPKLPEGTWAITPSPRPAQPGTGDAVGHCGARLRRGPKWSTLTL